MAASFRMTAGCKTPGRTSRVSQRTEIDGRHFLHTGKSDAAGADLFDTLVVTDAVIPDGPACQQRPCGIVEGKEEDPPQPQDANVIIPMNP